MRKGVMPGWRDLTKVPAKQVNNNNKHRSSSFMCINTYNSMTTLRENCYPHFTDKI